MEAGHRRRVALEKSVEDQLADLDKTVAAALNHPLWRQAEENRSLRNQIESGIEQTMSIFKSSTIDASIISESKEGGRQYFEATAGVDGRVRLDLATERQREREEAERVAEVRAMEAAHRAARRGRQAAKAQRHAQAVVLVRALVEGLTDNVRPICSPPFTPLAPMV